MGKIAKPRTGGANGKTTRRGFLGAVMASVAGWLAFPRKANAGGPSPHGGSGPRWGMAIDMDRCTACQACVAACSVENNLMLGGPRQAERDRINRWIHIVPMGEDDGARRSLVPMPCQQCENPPCIKVCPTSATYINPEGIVGQVYPRCIGCRYCVNACPYTCKYFNWWDEKWPEPLVQTQNPDVSTRYRGVVEKCLFCHQRLQRARDRARAEGREVRDEEYVPACAAGCPAKAITFGNINDPDSEVAKKFRDPRATFLLEDLGTHPKVAYLREN